MTDTDTEEERADKAELERAMKALSDAADGFSHRAVSTACLMLAAAIIVDHKGKEWGDVQTLTNFATETLAAFVRLNYEASDEEIGQ